MATRVHHPVFARMYQRMSASMEAAGVAEHRHKLLAGLAGRVVEVGAGNGLNFSHYPETVGEVIAVEPESYLRARAEFAARNAPILVRVVDGDAEHLPFEDGSIDAAVTSSSSTQLPGTPAVSYIQFVGGACIEYRIKKLLGTRDTNARQPVRVPAVIDLE